MMTMSFCQKKRCMLGTMEHYLRWIIGIQVRFTKTAILLSGHIEMGTISKAQ